MTMGECEAFPSLDVCIIHTFSVPEQHYCFMVWLLAQAKAISSNLTTDTLAHLHGM